MREFATWNGHNVFTIQMAGSKGFVLANLETLVKDFEQYEDSGDYFYEE